MAADKDDSAMSQPWPCYPVKPPPRGEDLPYDDGVPMESEMHVLQMGLLTESLRIGWADRNDFYVGGNMFVYFSELQSKKNDFRGPDVFVVLDTVRKVRRSWVVWEEGGRTPDVVIEITSPSTEAVDRGEKKRIYARVLRTPEYFLYDPFEKRLEGYRLDADRGEYEPMAPDERGWFRSKMLGLWLGVQRGTYQQVDELWLRWIDDDGRALPTGTERGDSIAAQAQSKVAQAESKAAQAESKAAQAESKAEQAESKAAQAESKAAEAESKVAQFESRFERAELEARRARDRVRDAARALLAAGHSPSEVASLLGISVDELEK